MNKLYSNIVPKPVLRQVQRATLAQIAASLSNSFGPDGSTTAYRKEKALAKYTKDGHTILKNIVFSGPIEVTMRDDLESITRRIVTTVGDGTTSAVILSHCLFESLCDAAEVLGVDEHVLVQDLKSAISEACSYIEGNKQECTLETIYKIAMVATNGNEFISKTIQEIYEKQGMGVFIDVGCSNSVNTVVKTYDGFTINEGLCDTAFINDSQKHVSELRKPSLYIFESPIDTPEMQSLLSKIIYDNVYAPYKEQKAEAMVPTVVFCPKISRDMNSMMDNLIKFMGQFKAEDRLLTAPINVVTNINDMNYLNDLAYLSGATLIKKYIDPETQKKDQEAGIAPTLETIHSFAGTADSCVTDTTKTKIVNPKNMHNEDGTFTDMFTNRLNDMKAQLAGMEETKEDITSIGMLKRRINSFQSNLVEIMVGGISETDRDAVRDLVEDAVLNCRSASKDGVGFGANFEGFRVFNMLAAKAQKAMTQEEVQAVSTGTKYEINTLILRAYMDLLRILYHTASGRDVEVADGIITKQIPNQAPYNIRTKQYDDMILGSIKTDIVILEAISTIVSMVFETNQFLVASYQYNNYSADEFVQVAEPIVANPNPVKIEVAADQATEIKK